MWRRFLRAVRVWTKRLVVGAVVVCALVVALAVAVVIEEPKLAVAATYWRAPGAYVVPVAGVRASDLRSTWGAPRSGGRRHKGVDIFARKGTPVVSATDGVVWRVGTDRLGGKVVWVVGEGASAYYYAHLDGFREGIKRGDHVRAGEELGRVGNTGNARTTPSHLHFSIVRLPPFGAGSVDPVPVLAQAETVATDARSIAAQGARVR